MSYLLAHSLHSLECDMRPLSPLLFWSWISGEGEKGFVGKYGEGRRESKGEHRFTVLDVCGNGFPTSARSEAHLIPQYSPREGPELSKVLKSVNKVKPGLFSLTDILVPVPLLLASRARASFTLTSGISVVVTQGSVHRGTLPLVQRSAVPILKCAVNSGQRVLCWHLALGCPCYLACSVPPKVLKTSGFSSEKGKQQAVFLTPPIHRLWRIAIC